MLYIAGYEYEIVVQSRGRNENIEIGDDHTFSLQIATYPRKPLHDWLV